MIGQLTAAGVAALQGSQLVNIPLAKIGDGYNYIPAPTDTDIHGNEVWRTQPSEPMATSPNIVRWSVFMDMNVGPFEFGEVGLFLPNGDLFALFAADKLIEKINVGGANLGNKVNLLIFVSMVGDNYVIWLDLASTNNQLQVARVNSPDQLPQPRDAYPNIYIMPGADDNQQSILAVTDRQGLWAFGGYDLADTLRATIVGFDSNSVTIDATDYNENMIPAYFGQLILQFNTGRLYGICRYIKTTNQSGTTWRLSFNTPLTMTPDVGDTIFIQKRNPLTLESGNLPIATRTAVGAVMPLESLTLDSAGHIGVDWTKLMFNGEPAVQAGDGGSFTVEISQVGHTGQYGHLLNIPPAFMPFLASDTQRGGMKIDSVNTPLYLDANETLQINTSGLIPTVTGLVNPTLIPGGADLSSAVYRTTGLFYTNNSAGLVSAPPLPAGPATLEVVPVGAGTAPGTVTQRWTQAEGLAYRSNAGGTFSSWIVTGSVAPATKNALGLVQIGDNINVDGNGLITVPTATNASLGVVKGGNGVNIDTDGIITIPGVVLTVNNQPGPDVTLDYDDVDALPEDGGIVTAVLPDNNTTYLVGGAFYEYTGASTTWNVPVPPDPDQAKVAHQFSVYSSQGSTITLTGAVKGAPPPIAPGMVVHFRLLSDNTYAVYPTDQTAPVVDVATFDPATAVNGVVYNITGASQTITLTTAHGAIFQECSIFNFTAGTVLTFAGAVRATASGGLNMSPNTVASLKWVPSLNSFILFGDTAP